MERQVLHRGGKYPVTASGARSDKYFSYLDGSLTVSLKKQKINFDQEFIDINALSLPIALTGTSLEMKNLIAPQI